MAKQPRIYLFHGNDSRASSRALSVWDKRFQEKFGTATRHIFNADELNPDQVEKRVRESLSVRGMFPEPTLLIIKRITSNDRSGGSPMSQKVIAVLTDMLRTIDETMTVAIWEDKHLVDRHVLMQWFLEHEARFTTKIHVHHAPSTETGVQIAEGYLRESEMRLLPPAKTWIREQLQWLEKSARGAKRLKSTEQLAQDERSWWLYHTLDAAMLQSQNGEVGVRELEMGTGERYIPISVFECVNALVSGKYDEARRLLNGWQRSSDEAAFYGLYALLRRQYGDRRNAFALRLLADIEIISKNTQVSHRWLMDMFILRMQQATTEGLYLPIIQPRRLWQAQLPRS